MEKYFDLSLEKAIRFFIFHDNKIIRENVELLGNVISDPDKPRVTITIPTHRTAPDSMQDPILLKNQISEATGKLSEKYDKKLVAGILDNMQQAEKAIDHSHNLEGLILYANKDFAAVVKVPAELMPGITVGSYFDVRPLYKAQQQLNNYYILTISQQKIRLINALNDLVLLEYQDENFPFANTSYFTTDAIKLAQDVFMENQIKEYFNDADKLFKYYQAANKLPIILAGDVKSTSYYQKEMDDDSMVIKYLPGNYDHVPTHEIAKAAYPLLEEYRNEKQKSNLSKIEGGRSGKRLTSDFNEIYTAAIQGNADTLYLSDNFTLKGKIEDEQLIIDKTETDNPESEDLTINILEKVQETGGNIIFMQDDLLDKYNGMALLKRFSANY